LILNQSWPNLKMGIPKFYAWYIKQDIFKATVSSQAPQNVDIFAIDMNGLIHNNAQKVFGYGEFDRPPEQTGVVQQGGVLMYSVQDLYAKRYEIFRRVFQDVLGLTQTVRPKQSLILAIDGVAPQAKINQQRNRRYKAATERKPEQVFDPNSITPGTDFMFELDRFIRDEINRITAAKQQGGVYDPYGSVLPPHIIYSSHLVPGEGEHKIADHLRVMPAENRTVVIYGADADLIMIYLMHLRRGWNNIYLFRENNLNYTVQAMISLKDLEIILRQLYRGASFPADDFVTLLFLNGNDFLPRFPIFERVDDALRVLIGGYMEFLQQNPGKGITTGTGIDWRNFSLFLQYIADKYGDNLLRSWGLNEDNMIKFPSLVAQKCIVQKKQVIGLESKCIREFDLEKFKYEWYRYVFSSKTGTSVIIPSTEDKEEMIHYYLEGLAWVYGYYRNGANGVNLSWYYPYHYSPLFKDIPKYMTGRVERGEITWETNPVYLLSKFVSPLEQLIMVLPPASLTSVPRELHSLYSISSPIYDLLPEGFIVDPYGKMEEWQAHAILPIPEPVRVERAVITLGLPQGYLDRYKPQESLSINLSMRQGYPVRRTYGISRGRGRGRGRARGRGRI